MSTHFAFDMPKVPEKYAEARMQEILLAAASCFSRNGYRATPMAEIAAEAGLSVGALYRYFPSKQKLFHSMFENADSQNRLIWDKASKMTTAAEGLEYVITAYLDGLERSDCRWALALDVRLRTEALNNKVLMRRVKQSYQFQIQRFTDLLSHSERERNQHRSEILEPARICAAAIIGLLNEARYQTLIGPCIDIDGFKLKIIAIAQSFLQEPRQKQRSKILTKKPLNSHPRKSR